MKKSVLLSVLVLCSIGSYSQRLFLKEKPTNQKSAVSFTAPTPSVMFFGANDGSTGYKSHKQNGKAVNAYFGAVYNNFPIFDIAKENIVEYNNANGKFFFYRPNTKNPFGMIISNGKDEPILVANPEQYLKRIKTYLNIGNADYLVTKTLDERDEKNALNEMERVLKLNFVAEKNYAQKLIKNANSVHYTPTYEDGSPKMTCKKRVFEMFSDSLLTLKSAYGGFYLYNDKNQMELMTNTLNGKTNGYSKYVRDENGLIKKIINGDEKSSDSTVFIYQKDKYFTVSFDKGRPYSLETYFLNDQLQCVRRLASRSDQSLIWDITYIYDKFGRIISERKIDSEMIYHYNKDSDVLFSGFESFSLNPRKLNLQNKVTREKNRHIFIGKNGEGEQNFKSITYTAKDGSTKTYSYNKDNVLTSVGVIRCL